jgi:CBS domain-containing protein
MSKAYEVMTHALATCPPEENVANVAALMRDREVGDVLIVENGNLKGIVTDRDLALKALTGDYDPLDTPVHKFMTSDVVTGDADWDVKKVAKLMAKHQIRRLPILENGELAGIISLGDVALYEGNKDMVSKSLHQISKPNDNSGRGPNRRTGAWVGLGLAALAATLATWLTYNRSGQEFRKQVMNSKYYHTAEKAAKQAAHQAVKNARDKVDQAASSKTVKNFRRQVRANLKDISTQLPTFEYKRPRRKFLWFG